MTCIIYEDDFLGSEKYKSEKDLKKFFDTSIHELGEKFELILFKRGDKTFILKGPQGTTDS